VLANKEAGVIDGIWGSCQDTPGLVDVGLFVIPSRPEAIVL
jgi:hypothetical protein